MEHKMIYLLSALIFLIPFGPVHAGSDEVPGFEQDRGTVKMPDYVAVPHPGGIKTQDQRLSNVPNRSLANDQNADGVVSQGEWKGRAVDFHQLDFNRDGVLSQRELSSYIQVGIDRFAELDANRDGVLTKNEWKDPSHFFRKLDADKDGQLTRPEYYPNAR